jgi:DNA-damage-inducible protein J
MLTKVAHDHALPFDPLIPNATTIAAMKEARAGNLPKANTLDELKKALNADD